MTDQRLPARPLVADADDVHRYMGRVWPARQEAYHPSRFAVLRPGFCRYRHTVGAEDLRPGGTVSGPTLMRLADVATYALILAHLGEAALAVTTSLSIDFVRRSRGPQLYVDAELVKLGRSLATARVTIASADAGAEPDMSRPVAIASVTYSLALVSDQEPDAGS